MPYFILFFILLIMGAGIIYLLSALYQLNNRLIPLVNITLNFFSFCEIPYQDRKKLLKKFYLKNCKLKKRLIIYIDDYYKSTFRDKEKYYEKIYKYNNFEKRKKFLKNLLAVSLNYNLLSKDVIDFIFEIGEGVGVGGGYLADLLINFYFEGFKQVFNNYEQERANADPDYKRKDFKADPYQVLKVPAMSNFKTVKAAYKKQVLKYHPDRMINATPDQKKHAENRMKLLNIAYQIIKIQRGF